MSPNPPDILTVALDGATILLPAVFGAGIAWGMMRGTIRALREELVAQRVDMKALAAKIDDIESEQRDLDVKIAGLPTRQDVADLRREIADGFGALNKQIVALAARAP